jgi:hypothetical protein
MKDAQISFFGFALVDIKKKEKKLKISVDGKKVSISIKDKNADEVYEFLEKELDEIIIKMTYNSPDSFTCAKKWLKEIGLKKENNYVYFIDNRRKKTIICV